MKKVKSYEDIKSGTIFSINQAGNIYHHPLNTIVEGEAVAWKDLAVGTMYYESNDIDGINQDSIKDLDVIEGKGILIYKHKKIANNSMSIGGLNITIISDKQRKIKCYKAKDKSPRLIVHKIDGNNMNNTNSYRIVSAAMLMQDGLIIPGTRHFSTDMNAILERIYGKEYKYQVKEQGFIDSHGNFLSRKEAWIRADINGQIFLYDPSGKGKLIHQPANQGTHEILFSENLY